MHISRAQYMGENGDLLEAAHENMNLGRLHESLQYQLQLQQNLIYLATLADDHPSLEPLTVTQPDVSAASAGPSRRKRRADEGEGEAGAEAGAEGEAERPPPGGLGGGGADGDGGGGQPRGAEAEQFGAELEEQDDIAALLRAHCERKEWERQQSERAAEARRRGAPRED